MINNKRKYNPVSAGIAYTLGNVLIKAIPFLTLPIFTRILSTADFGLYNTYLAYENIITIVLGLGLNGTVRIAKVEYKKEFERYVSSIFGLQMITSSIIDAVLIIIFALINPNIWMDLNLFIVLLINCFSVQIYNIASAKYAINGQVKENLLFSILLTVLNVGVSLILCLSIYSSSTYRGRIIGTCFAAFTVAIIIFLLQLRKSISLYNKSFWRFGLLMGGPLIMHALSATLLSQCDKIMIQNFVGDSEAGIYSIAVTLSGIIAVLVTSFDNAWAPWFYQKLEEKKYTEVFKYNNYIVYAFTFITTSIMLVSPEIIRIMTSKVYWDSVYAFPVLLLSILFNLFYLIPVNFEYYNKNTKYIAVATLTAAITNIILNFVFIQMFGYLGAAYATLISKILLLFMHWKKAWKIKKVKLIGVLNVVICSIFSLAMCFFVIINNEDIVIRFVVLVVLVISCFVFLKKNGLIDYYVSKIKNRTSGKGDKIK